MSVDSPLYVALTAGLFVIGLVVLFVGSTGMGAPDDGADGAGGESDWLDRDRVLFVQTDRQNWFRFTTRPQANQSADLLQGQFISSEATYRFEFQDRPREEDGSATNDTWMAVELDFVGLVEYRDETGDETFNPPSDQVVQRLWLSGNRSSSLSVEETATGAKRVNTTFPFDGGGSLEVSLLVSPTTYQVRDAGHPPTVTSVDVRLEDFPFEENGTEVALHLNLATPGPLSLDADESRVRIPAEGEDDTLEGRFAWSRHLDGTSRMTNATVVEAPLGDSPATGARADVLFTYPGDEEFVHATTVGIHRSPTFTQEALQFLGNWYIFAGALTATLALLGGSMYAKLRNEGSGPPY